ncbi:alpha/beta hydrolase [Vagococcus entomophilus]|nr:alpha/beta hydrolase-fold protein [Vagococcus entomophilus]
MRTEMRTVKIKERYLDIYAPKIIEKDVPINLLYVLDGDAFANMIGEVVKLQTRNTPKTGVSPILVVGLSYHGETSFSRERRFQDYTPKKVNPVAENDPRKDFPQGGNLDSFLESIKQAHQFILSEYTINPEKVGFFGHSLGGLCVLETYLRETLPFVTDYIAVSPSLWWDQEMFFKRLALAPMIAKKNVHLSVGSLEGDMVPLAKRAKEELLLSQMTKKLNFYVAQDENHMSVVTQTISRNLRWFCQ